MSLKNYSLKKDIDGWQLLLLYKGSVIVGRVYPLTEPLFKIWEGAPKVKTTLNWLIENQPELFSKEKLNEAIELHQAPLRERLSWTKLRREKQGTICSHYFREDVMNSVKKVLKESFSEYIHSLKGDIFDNALPLIANFANLYAKTISGEYYDNKDVLTEYISVNYSNCWSRGDGILYAETEVGQVSFHVFDGQDEKALINGLNPSFRVWDDNNAQSRAEELFQEYLDMNEVTPSFEPREYHEYSYIEYYFDMNKGSKFKIA